jgi:DNA replication protein DnaC
MSIREQAGELMLSYTARNYGLHVDEATATAMPYDKFLEELFFREIECRRENRLKKRVVAAKFPYKKYLVDFKTDHLNKDAIRRINSLKTLEFIKNGENLILIGNPGVGKSHLAIALGVEACLRDMRVMFAGVPNLMIELKESMSLNQLGAYKKKFEKYDLVILDELGYVSFDKGGNEILFNLLSGRNDNGSLIITTNLVFERWDEIFKDTVLTGALVDRIAHKSHVIDMSGESYRIRETKQWIEQKEAAYRNSNG